MNTQANFDTLFKNIKSICRQESTVDKKTGIKYTGNVMEYEYKGNKITYHMTDRDITLLVEDLLNGEPVHLHFRQALVKLEAIERGFIMKSVDRVYYEEVKADGLSKTIPHNIPARNNMEDYEARWAKYYAIKHNMCDARAPFDPEFGAKTIDQFKKLGINPMYEVPTINKTILENRTIFKVPNYSKTYTQQEIDVLKANQKKSMIAAIMAGGKTAHMSFAKDLYLWGLLYQYSLSDMKTKEMNNPRV